MKDVIKLFLIFCSALVLRLGFWYKFIKPDPSRAFYTIDSYTYEFPAINLIQKGKYINDCPREFPKNFPQKCVPSADPEIYRPPVYPLFIAVHYAIFGERPELVIFSQNIIDASKIFVMYKLSKLLGLTGNFSLVPSLIYAISPIPILHAQAMMTEPLQGFLLLILFVLALSAPKFKNAFLSGLVVGILALLHPIWYLFGMVFPILYFAVLWRISKSTSQNLKLAIYTGLAFSLSILPWFIRNYMIWNLFIFRPGDFVFLCEVYQKMKKGMWLGSYKDLELYNMASEEFKWGVKFSSQEEVNNYPMNLTKELQVGKICRREIIKNFWKYPFEIHIAGVFRSSPPFGIAHLYFTITGNISPSSEELTLSIVPKLLQGKVKEVFEEVKEKRLKLLSFGWWLFYGTAWLIRIFSLVFAILSIFRKEKIAETFFAIFTIVYGTFLVTTFESAQPRRFFTVDPIVVILSAVGVRNIFRMSRYFPHKAEKVFS